MSNIDIFTNDKFRILSYLYDMKDNSNLVRITQTELVSELKLSRGTINSVFKQFKESGYLVHDETRVGRYYLTAEALNVVESFRNSEKSVEEE